MMDKTYLLERLAHAERLVAEREHRLSRQRAIVERLAREGLDTRTAQALLQEFEKTLAFHLAKRDRARSELQETMSARRPTDDPRRISAKGK